MAPEKVTEMVLNVDLKCSGCYKKVKKVICKIPQIRDQVFDVDKNKVKLIVVCCSPEKIRDKLCYKGGGAIQSIEIVEKPKPAEKPKDAVKPKPTDKLKEPEKPKPTDKPKEADKPKPADKPKEADKPKPADKPKDAGKPKEPETAKPDKPKEPEKPKPKEADKPPQLKEAAPKKADAAPAPAPAPGPSPDVAKMVFEPVQGYPQMYPPSAYPMVGCGHYYDQGYGGAPFQHGYGMPVAPPPPPSYNGFGYEYGYGYNDNRSYHTNNDYVGEGNSEGCAIM